ncbi:MAG: 3-keto-5-aminohexanoate cleavage protein [Chloroflexi bacterium]|nr:3-keto-5-aminohexanoate cleavage protein [Chloroflexota bacterium]
MVQPEIDLAIEEAKKVFAAHRETPDQTMAKKLIINVAASGSFIDRRHNPNIPITAEEVAREVGRAWDAGASMWHFHPRDPETGLAVKLGLDKRLQIHKNWCDAVFSRAPDIITDVGAIYVTPWKQVKGTLVDENSILAETRLAPLIDRLVMLGPKNRYVEVAISLCTCGATGGTNSISFNNRPGIVSDVEFLQSRGVRVELSPFHHADLANVKEWVLDTGLAKAPVILDTLLGVHNSPCPRPGLEAFEWLFTYVRMLPRGVLWQTLLGGRFWLPLTMAAIALGADIVRVGMEDAMYMYPHSTSPIDSNARVVEAVAGMARYMGREVAMPAEARQILGLPQVQAGP